MGVADSPLAGQVLFVEGSQRSGTTWLNTLLAAHPDLAGGSLELHLFNRGLDGLFHNHEGWDANQTGIAPLVPREMLVDLARDLGDAVLLRLREQTKPGARYVVEKTPTDFDPLAVVRRKAEIYPDAWHLHIVRDGQAVVASLMRAPWIADRSEEACTRQWSEAVGAIREVLGDHPRYREIRYEDLVADPVAVCRDVFRWLGIRDDPETLEQVRLCADEPGAVVGEGVEVDRRAFLRARVRHRIGGLLRTVRARRHAPAGTSLEARFAEAFRQRDAEALRRLTTDDLGLELRSGAGDRRESGDAARAALLEVAEAAFGRMAIAETWEVTLGLRYHTVIASIRTADARRTDMVLALVPRGDRIRHVTLVSAGDPAGRPLARFGE